MIKINLQWFAWPCWIYAMIQMSFGLAVFFRSIGKPDIMPMIGISVLIESAMWAAGSATLGYLIHRAFRPEKEEAQ